MLDIEVGPVQKEEIKPLWDILAQSLHLFMPSDWPQRLGPERFRVIRHHGVVAGGLAIIEMAQWFGGQRVPTAGITAVGVAPEHRGRGTASLLMLKALEEAHSLGFPISTLYPSTVALYRRLGYQRAGLKTVYELPIKTIDIKERPLDVVPAGESDYEELYHTYNQRAQATSGNLDRPLFLWDALLGTAGQGIHKYLLARDGQVEGYVVFQQARSANHIRVRDMALLTRDAGVRLLKFFSDHRSIIETVSWNGPPNDPLSFLHSEEEVKPARTSEWMVRIVDVQKALTLRGYPPGLEAEIHLKVGDDLLPWNAGKYVLQVSGGRGRVRKGGQEHLRMDARGLAAMYTSHLTPTELKAVGELEASEEHLARAELVFSGPRPWMPDQF